MFPLKFVFFPLQAPVGFKNREREWFSGARLSFAEIVLYDSRGPALIDQQRLVDDLTCSSCSISCPLFQLPPLATLVGNVSRSVWFHSDE